IMTLPNKLTLITNLLIPAMIIIYYIPWFKENIAFLEVSWLYLITAIIFIVASLTDFLDGFIARKYNLVTTFGKLADPLADKMLTFSAMAILMVDGYVPMWVFVVILIREFTVSGIRMVAIERGEVIAAGKLGKFKTATTMVAIIVLLFSGLHQYVNLAGSILMYVACALTIISGIEYFWNSRKIIFESI
ncbi:MAG: CDP-diacylglycerol--glycerol-3-phosphate 3-phosphatidyltransferase, partial [Acholeplasmatales bacterium]|nr:CDP-diacylglycerol--glycerol-3-phosphate 3-phosphatidyltransferase [Acholeplasmatales bacterium]